MRFHRVKVPTQEERLALTNMLSQRVARFLERRGLLDRDAENSYRVFEQQEEDAMEQRFGHSITYRIAMGPHQGRKVFTLQTVPPRADPNEVGQAAKVASFSWHAGVVAEPHPRDKLERLCRYISRPAVSEQRLALTANGKVRYPLKTPYRDGTTHVILEPLDCIARLAALVSKPRVNLTRFAGGFAPNSQHRALVTPAKRAKGKKAGGFVEPQSVVERRAAMTWAQRLKRVFNIDIETCEHWAGQVKVSANIEAPVGIKKSLEHLKNKASTNEPGALPENRAPAQLELSPS